MLFTIISGCAVFHMSQQECISTDWEQAGFADGSAGNPQRNLAGAIEDCAKFGISVNQKTYYKGWKSGVKQFCTYDGGYAVGSRGQTPPNICEGRSYDAFMSGWTRGNENFCSDSEMAYNLGLNNQPFPTVCSQSASPGFQAEYDRGIHEFRHEEFRREIYQIKEQERRERHREWEREHRHDHHKHHDNDKSDSKDSNDKDSKEPKDSKNLSTPSPSVAPTK